MELLVIAIVLTLAGAQQSELEGPQSTLSIVGSTVTLKCSSPSRNCIGIDWRKYIPGSTPMTIFKGPRTILNNNVTDRKRYSVDNSSGCDFVIRNVQLTDAGRFICSAIISSSHVTRTAHLIVLAVQPKCTSNASLLDTFEGAEVQLKCEVTYNGINRASMVWKGVASAQAAVKNGTTISRSYFTVASAPDIPSFTCETSFTIETDDNGKPIEGLATNRIPNAICSTSAIKVLYSVRDVTLSPSYSNHPPGTIVTCAANGHPPPTFKWQETENGIWMDIQNEKSSEFTMTDLSSKRYRCVAMNFVRGRSIDAPSSEIMFDNADPVRDVILMPSLSKYPPGTVVTCAAKGHPSPTFKWQERETDAPWMDIQNYWCSSIFTVTDVSSKRYRCVAMNVVMDRNYSATSYEILVSNTDRLGIGVGIGLLVAILLATVASVILFRLGYVDLHSRPANKTPDGGAQHRDQEMSPSLHQISAVHPSASRPKAPIPGEQETVYANLGEDRDANEYASLEQRQKAKPKKKSRH